MSLNILDSREYEKINKALELLKLLMPAEENINQGEYQEARSFFKELKNAKNI